MLLNESMYAVHANILNLSFIGIWNTGKKHVKTVPED